MKKIAIVLFFFPIITFGQSLIVEVEQLFQNKNYSDAEKIISSYLDDRPDDLEAIELLGDSFGFQKKWDDAISAYKRLADKDELNANYHYKYGGALGMKALSSNKLKALMLIDDIKEEFLMAADLDPGHIDVRWALVELYMQLPGIFGGSKKKSLRYAEELQDLSTVDGYLAKGYVYEYDNEPQKAEYYYRLAIETGGSITCFQKLTTFYENEKQPIKAIATIEEARDVHQRNAMHYQIGKVCAEYNVQLDKGVKCLNTFIQNHSVKDGVPIEWAYYRLAQIYKHKKDKVKAMESINLSLDINPDFKVAIEEKESIYNM